MHEFFKKINKNKAFTLVETLVAISIFTVSILGLISVLASGISDTGYAKKKMVATYLAQEGIEYVRNARDAYVLFPDVNGTSWDYFVDTISECVAGNECGFDRPISDYFFDDDLHLCSIAFDCKLYINNGGYDTYSIGTDSGFTRKLWTEAVSDDEIKVYSTVSWTQGSGNYSITFSENLFNWIE